MATVGGVTGGDGGIAALQALVATLTDKLNETNQMMTQYNSSTLEGSQALAALNDRKALYEQAIGAYSDSLAKIKSTGDAATRGSAMKEQARKGYATGMATKKGATSAEAMKDIADISSEGATERASIKSQTDSNYASAASGLGNLYANIADQEAQLASIQAQSAASVAATNAQSALERYKAMLAAQGQGTTVVNESGMEREDLINNTVMEVYGQ